MTADERYQSTDSGRIRLTLLADKEIAMSDLTERLCDAVNADPASSEYEWAEVQALLREAAAELAQKDADIERLHEAIRVQAAAVRRMDVKERAEYVATQTLDSERDMNAILTAELEAEREKSARLAAERDEAQRRLHTAWVDQRDSKVEAAEAEVKRLAAENARLKSACDGLLTFIRQKYPADFADGGSGYSCEHHRKIAGLIYGTPEEPR